MSIPPHSQPPNGSASSLEELFEKTQKLEAENMTLRANAVTFNEMTAQRLFLQRALTGNAFGEINTSPLNRDYYGQFGYPQAINKEQYQRLYDRNVLASRVVRLFPMECWQTSPIVSDKDAPSESSFEAEFKDICQEHSFWEVLERADILSGIGAYGIILFGLDDDASLDQPVTGYMDGTCNHNLPDFRSGAAGHPKNKVSRYRPRHFERYRTQPNVRPNASKTDISKIEHFSEELPDISRR